MVDLLCRGWPEISRQLAYDPVVCVDCVVVSLLAVLTWPVQIIMCCPKNGLVHFWPDSTIFTSELFASIYTT